MAVSEELKEQIAIGMFDRGLLGFPEGGITLKSGRQSPYYYNDRPNLSFSRVLDREGRMSIDQQRQFRRALAQGFGECFLGLNSDVDHVFGKAQAGTAPVAVGAYEAGLSYIWERVDEPGKSYGAHQKIEGSIEAGESVSIGDDVVTDGASKLEGARVLTEAGLVVGSVVIKFDREEGGFDPIIKAGYEVAALITLSEAVVYLGANNRINEENVDALAEYHQGLVQEGVNSTYRFAD